MTKTIIAICGNKGSGKDTLAYDLLERYPFPMRHIIYSKGKDFDEIRKQVSLEKDKTRFAFADLLKHEFEEERQIKITDENKEYYRNDLAIFSYNKKSQDPLYYTKKILDYDNNIIILTDLRLPEELNFIKTIPNCEIITIRTLFLSQDCDKSTYERRLDNVETDFVAVRY